MLADDSMRKWKMKDKNTHAAKCEKAVWQIESFDFFGEKQSEV
jgi:hypothetical protein